MTTTAPSLTAPLNAHAAPPRPGYAHAHWYFLTAFAVVGAGVLALPSFRPMEVGRMGERRRWAYPLLLAWTVFMQLSFGPMAFSGLWQAFGGWFAAPA
jgi:hypothetical protein